MILFFLYMSMLCRNSAPRAFSFVCVLFYTCVNEDYLCRYEYEGVMLA